MGGNKLAIVAPFSTRAALGFRIFNIAKRLKPHRIIFHARDKYGESERLYEGQFNLWWRKSFWLIPIHCFQIFLGTLGCDTIYYFKPLPLNAFNAFWMRLLGKKIMFDFDEWEPYTQQEYVKGLGGGVRSWLVGSILGLMGRLCSKISCGITTSNWRINEFILKKDRCLLIPNGVDYGEYAGEGRAFELKKEVAYAGSLHYSSLLLPFFLQVPKGFRLHIYGEGRAREEIEWALKKRGIGHVFHGYVKPAELSRELKKFRGIFLAPYMSMRNIAYSSAGKIPQYMALGQPVVVSAVDGPLDYARGEECFYLLEPGRERELGGLIRSIYASRKEAAGKAALAQRIVREHFDWRAMCARLREFISAC